MIGSSASSLTSCPRQKCLRYLSQERLWGIIVCCVAFCAFFLLLGNFYAASVLYDELVKPPCDDNDLARPGPTANSSNCTQTQTQPVAHRNIPTCRHDNDNTSKECGGFGQSRGNTAWITSVQLSAMFLISPFAGILVDRFGCRKVAFSGGVLMTASILSSSLVSSLTPFILLYGFTGGSGIGLLYSPTIVMVSRYFKKKHSIANGIALSGAGVGTMSLGPLSHHIIEAAGWRGYIRVYGCLILLLTFLTLLYKPVNNTREGVTQKCPSSETDDSRDDVKSVVEENFDLPGQDQDRSTAKRNIVDWTIWRQASVFLFLGTAELFRLGFTVPMIHVVRFASDLNIASQDAALLVTYQGIGSLTGRISLGLIAANRRLKPMLLFWLCIIMTGIPMLFAAQITSYIQLSVYIAFYGYFIGGQVTLQAVVLRQLVGVDRLAQTLGWYMGLQAPVALVGGPIGGFIYDASGSYSWAFYFGGIVILMAAATMSFMPCVLRYDARRGLYHFRPRTVTPNNRDEQIGQVEVGRNNELIGERETPNSEL